MTDEKKTSRWTKNLEKAGLIGKVQDAWVLPEASEEEPPVIVVEEIRETQPPLMEDDDDPIVSTIEESIDTSAASRSTDPVPLGERPTVDLHRAMNEREQMGDHSGALEIAEQILDGNPEDSDASFMRLKCRKTLMQMYESRIGSFRRIPIRIVSEEEIIWRNLDPVAGFIAASVDGFVSFEDIIDISTLSRFDTCRVLNQLLQDGIIQ
jgi:hypothetical protein